MGCREDFTGDVSKYDAKLRSLFKNEELIPRTMNCTPDEEIAMVRNPKQDNVFKGEKEFVQLYSQDDSLLISMHEASKLVVKEKV